MTEINYKHLRYFWMVGKAGSIARASEQLCITPQSISGQITELEQNLNIVLFRKVGRGLELTDMGRKVFNYADEIFSLGSELSEFIRNAEQKKTDVFRIGIADCIAKSIATKIIQPIFTLEDSMRLICKEGKLDNLLSDLSVHKLDVVIADRPMQTNLNVRAYNHVLGRSILGVFGTKRLMQKYGDLAFPQLLNKANFLMPGDDFAFKSKLIQWLELNKIYPNIVAEFDDSALLKSFGQLDVGFFPAPHAIADYVCSQYKVELVGTVNSVFDQLYAISTERRIKHPAMLSIIKSTAEIYNIA